MSKLNKQDKEALELWRVKCKEIATATQVKNPKETKAEKAKRIEKAKKNYSFFVSYYFPHYAKAPCAKFHIEAAQEILKNKNIFAILEWAREHAKSVHVCVIIPMWLMIHKELDGMVLVNKSFEGAKKLLGDLQAELQSNETYIHDFGEQFNHGSWEEGNFITKNDIACVAYGRGQSPRGVRNKEKRPNYCVIDDIDDDEIVKNERRVLDVVDWILTSLYGALAIKGARVVVANNRTARKSILAHLVGDVEPGMPKREGIWHSKVNAIDEKGNVSWKENYTKAELQRKFDVMGYRRSQREYFNNPIVEGRVFKNEWIQWKPMLKPTEYQAQVIYFDPSFKSSSKNDFKAIRHWGKTPREFHCIKSFVRQASIAEAVRWVYDYYEELYPNLIGCGYMVPDAVVDIYMEANFIQDLLLDEFVAEGERRGWQLPIRPDRRQKPDKYSRIEQLTPFYERNMVFFNEAEKSSRDMLTGIEQLLAIEPGSNTHDDAPDADEGAIYILQQRGRAKATPPRLGVRPQRGW